jgi:hypothetical protein
MNDEQYLKRKEEDLDDLDCRIDMMRTDLRYEEERRARLAEEVRALRAEVSSRKGKKASASAE